MTPSYVFYECHVDDSARVTTYHFDDRIVHYLFRNLLGVVSIQVFFTACGSASGYGGHTGGAYDTVPEVMLMDAFFRSRPDAFVPTFFDEAGHRVATQYLMSVLRGEMPAERLVEYRRGHAHLPGHPELGMTPGVEFSSGRLGHLWPYVNGVAMAEPSRAVFCLGSDGSQMEGNDAEAARLAVLKGLNVKLVVDDNDVTIAGHPSTYMKGYNVENTLRGHGMKVEIVKGEDLNDLFRALRNAVTTTGPYAVVVKRSMCPGIKSIEGTTHGHDVRIFSPPLSPIDTAHGYSHRRTNNARCSHKQAIAKDKALQYLSRRADEETAESRSGLLAAVTHLQNVKKTSDPYGTYLGSDGSSGSNRNVFGQTVVKIMNRMTAQEKANVLCIDSDLEGSVGFKHIRAAHADRYVKSGIMERGNLSACAGFGMKKGRQGIFATFAAFLEMCTSEITMARLNRSNLLCHFSHSGSDWMADNTCHFGLNNLFADNGLDDQYETKLYFPCDPTQMEACVERVFHDEGMRFVFSVRSKLPKILKEDGKTPFYGDGYKFVPCKDELIRDGTDGFIVSFGDAVYRAVDAVERLKKSGISVGLVNKSTLNVVDEEMMRKIGKSPFVLVVEPLSKRTGLGSKFGTWLLERGLSPKFGRIGVHREGCGGLWEHAYHQGYDSVSIQKKIKSMMA